MLEVTIWDVNHGSAAYIQTPANRRIAVDLGDASDFSPLQTLSNRGVEWLDAVVITHPHRDHLDDIFNFNLLAPRSLWRPRHLSEADIRNGNRAIDTNVIDEYLRIDRAYGGLLTDATNITVPATLTDATIQIFGGTSSRGTDNLNNHSLVVVVSYAELKMVIPGDNEAPSWDELLEIPSFVAAVMGADIFLASHHGRDAGYSNELFEAIGSPKLVIISDGRFGDTSATDRYSKEATGWLVHDSLGSSEIRRCVTTRCDGHITVRFGWSTDPQYRNFLTVTTSKINMSELAKRAFGL